MGWEKGDWEGEGKGKRKGEGVETRENETGQIEMVGRERRDPKWTKKQFDAKFDYVLIRI